MSKKEDWRSGTLAKALERGPLRRESFTRSGGEVVDAVYCGEDVGAEQALPGDFPFTRGIHSTMYRSRFWTMRQYAVSGRLQSRTSGTECSSTRGRRGCR